MGCIIVANSVALSFSRFHVVAS